MYTVIYRHWNEPNKWHEADEAKTEQDLLNRIKELTNKVWRVEEIRVHVQLDGSAHVWPYPMINKPSQS